VLKTEKYVVFVQFLKIKYRTQNVGFSQILHKINRFWLSLLLLFVTKNFISE